MAYENMSSLQQHELNTLRQEFSVLDVNGDGKVTKEEMLLFLAKKNIDEDHRVQIVDELFSKCDEDGNGEVDIKEFSQEYLSTKMQLQAREAELSSQIKDFYRQIQVKNKKLSSLGLKGPAVGPVGQLTVNVKSGYNLPNGSYVVVIQHGNLRHTTQAKNGPECYFNEPVIVNIDDETLNVVISVETASNGRPVLQAEVSFLDLNDPEKVEEFKDRKFSDVEQGNRGVAVICGFFYSPNLPVQLQHQIATLEFELKDAATLLT